MDNRWLKIKNTNNRKRHTLHSICVGFVFFGILCIFTSIFSKSLCPIKKIFGISCFGCGMTRGFIAILKLDIVSAFQYNALSIPIFIGVVIYSVCAIVDALFDKNCVLYIETQLAKKYMFFIYFVLLVVTIILRN